jgi:putative nucleotidyltransferase with HDIG domain
VIKKIQVADLEVGMFIDDMNAPYADHPFLTNKRRVKTAKDIDLLLHHNITEVYIDTDKGMDSLRAVAAEEADAVVRHELRRQVLEPAEPQAPEPAPVPAELVGYREEMEKAKKVYGEAKVMVKDLLKEARLGKSVDGEKAQVVVSGMVDSIFRNQDALLSLSRLKSYDDYTFQHSLNVSVLSLAMGRSLGLIQDELRRLGVGAILHDIGKMIIPEEILNKPGRLTDEEFTVMKSHTLQGAKILMKAPGVEEECVAVALNHHERFSGRGYPRGLEGMSIGKFGMISAIVDVYDAITSNRCYHTGVPSHQAIQKIYEWGKTDFYPVYVQKFIQCLGVYPIGTVVTLDTGEMGVVYQQNHTDLLRPWVRIVRGPDGAPLARPADADLREADTQGHKKTLRSIQSVILAEQSGLDVEKILGM